MKLKYHDIYKEIVKLPQGSHQIPKLHVQFENITKNSPSKLCNQNRIEHNTILTTNKIIVLPLSIRDKLLCLIMKKPHIMILSNNKKNRSKLY